RAARTQAQIANIRSCSYCLGTSHPYDVGLLSTIGKKVRNCITHMAIAMQTAKQTSIITPVQHQHCLIGWALWCPANKCGNRCCDSGNSAYTTGDLLDIHTRIRKLHRHCGLLLTSFKYGCLLEHRSGL